MSTVVAVATTPGEKITLRQAAIGALGRMGEDAIPVLIPMLDDKAVATDAALALGQITGTFLGTDRARWTQLYNDYKARKQKTGQ